MKKINLITSIVATLISSTAPIMASGFQEVDETKMSSSGVKEIQVAPFTPTEHWARELFEKTQEEIIQELRTLEFDINQTFSFTSRNGPANANILHAAAFQGYLDVLKYLVEEKEGDVNEKTSKRKTLLHIAASNGQLNVVKYLMDAGADVSEKTRGGLSFLHMAALNGHLSIVKYLADEKGWDLTEKTSNGVSLLDLVASNGHLSIVRYLVEEKGADVNQKDQGKDSLLQKAAKNGHLSVVKYLVEEKKGDINERDSGGFCLLHLTAFYGHIDIVKYLAEERNACIQWGHVWGVASQEIKTYLLDQKNKRISEILKRNTSSLTPKGEPNFTLESQRKRKLRDFQGQKAQGS